MSRSSESIKRIELTVETSARVAGVLFGYFIAAMWMWEIALGIGNVSSEVIAINAIGACLFGTFGTSMAYIGASWGSRRAKFICSWCAVVAVVVTVPMFPRDVCFAACAIVMIGALVMAAVGWLLRLVFQIWDRPQ